MAKIEKALMDEYLARETSGSLSGDRWEKYYREKAGWLVVLTDGTIFNIEKPRIETSFCFGESGHDYDEAVHAACEARTNEALFKVRNLRGIDETISLLKDGPKYEWRYKLAIWIAHGTSDMVREVTEEDLALPLKGGAFRLLSEEDKALLIKGYEIVREAFSKRIDAYLKRYGLSKVHSWTYWRDA